MSIQFPSAAMAPGLLSPSAPTALPSKHGETFHQALANASSDDKKLA